MAMDPDRAVPPPEPYTAITVGRMAALKWEMQARCGRCKVKLRVDLPALVKLHRADAIWWGRHPYCRVVGCRGRVTFWARSVQFGTWKSLGAPLTQTQLEMGRHAETRPIPEFKPVAIDWRRAIEWVDG